MELALTILFWAVAIVASLVALWYLFLFLILIATIVISIIVEWRD